jgi:hypothetical protein
MKKAFKVLCSMFKVQRQKERVQGFEDSRGRGLEDRDG